MLSYDPERPEKFCKNGLPLETCLNKAEEDLLYAKSKNKNIEMSYKQLRHSGECNCMAAWLALYEHGVSRV